MSDKWVEIPVARFEGRLVMEGCESIYLEYRNVDSDGKPSEIYARTGPYFEGTSGKSAPLKPV